MFYAVIGLIVLASIGLAIYAMINKRELVTRIFALQEHDREQEANYTVELDRLKSELAKLDKIKHIPNLLEKSRKLEAEIATKLKKTQVEADEIVLIPHKDSEKMKLRIATRLDKAE